MARNLAQNESFWKGIAAGFLAGIGVAAALRYTRFEKHIPAGSIVDSEPELALTSLHDSSILDIPRRRHAPAGFHSLRDQALLRDQTDLVGDPMILASARTGRAAEFVRAVKAPGGHILTELPEESDDAGERLDHIDASHPQRKFRRSFDMGSAG